MISLGLGQKGVAATAVAVAAVVIAGASTGTPVAIDEADVPPDSPLYGLERAGETIKEATYAGGQGWNLARAEERVQEYKNMAEQGKGKQFDGLPKQAAGRLSKAAKSADSENGLERAQKAIQKHIAVLENVKEKVPKVAKPAISLAISQSCRCQAVVSKVKSQAKGKKLGKQLKNELKKDIENVEKEVKRLRKRVRENLEEGEENKVRRRVRKRVRTREMVQNINMHTARCLDNMVEEMAKNGVSESEVSAVSGILERAKERINTATRAATDNKGLSRAIEASQKHLSVLQGVYEKVPEQAKSAIENAIKQSRIHQGILKNMKEQGEIAPENISKVTENIIEQIPKGVTSETLEENPEWTWLPENYEIVVKTWEENFVKVLLPEELENLIPADFPPEQEEWLPVEYSEWSAGSQIVVETWGKDYVKVLIPQPAESWKQRAKELMPGQENQGESPF